MPDLLDALLAAAVCALLALTGAQLELTYHRRSARRLRELERLLGAGAYEPTAGLPRDVDLRAAIVDHARLKFRPVAAALAPALRAAADFDSALRRVGEVFAAASPQLRLLHPPTKETPHA